MKPVASVLIPSLALVAFALGSTASASIRPEKIHVADTKKTQAYVDDGLFVGGDRAIDEIIVQDIRRAANVGYERIVVDLRSNKDGEASPVQRPPYFQVAVSPEERRLVMTIWGHPKLNFDAKKVVNAFRKSKIVGTVELFPRLDDQTWTVSMGLKAGVPVEVFELKDPVRLIVDIRTDKRR